MVVVGFDNDVLDLLLYADTQALRERCLKRAIDIGREQLRRYRGVRQRAKRSPEKEPRSFADSRSRLRQVLIRSKSRQRLNVAHVDYRVSRNNGMTRRNYAVQPIDSNEEETRRERTPDVAAVDLRIS